MATGGQQSKGNALADFVEVVKRRIDRGDTTISDLARKAGVGRPYLHRVLSGDQQPTITWMEKVGRELGISIKVVAK